MEALAIFGGVAAGCALTAEILRLSRSLRKMVKSIRYARHNISKIADEMNMFAKLFEDFRESCSNNQVSNARGSFSPEGLISWTKSSIRSFRILQRQVKALAIHSKYDRSLIEIIAAHAKWYLSRDSVKGLRASLSVARESIIAFTNINVIKKLDEQIKYLKRAVEQGSRRAIEERLGITVEEHIQALEQTKRNRRVMRRENEKRLQKAKEILVVHREESQDSDFVPNAHDLLDFTESVEEYIEDVLITTRSGSSTYVDSNQRSYSTTPTSTESTPNRADSESRQRSSRSPPLSTSSSSKQALVYASSPVSTQTPSFPNNNCSCLGLCSSPRIPSASSILTSSACSTAARPDQTRNNANGNDSYRSGRWREFINDPDGTILSPPKAKNPSPSTNMNTLATRRDAEPESTLAGERDTELSKVQAEEPDENDSSNDESEAEAGLENDNTDPSPFTPVAGVVGNFPPRWHQRHERSVSPQDFW